MRETETRAFFGDREHTFCLTPPMIAELERATDSAVGAIYGRLSRMEFAMRDVRETIRLGLIGGGMTPQRAAEMIETYVDPQPLAATASTALAVMVALFFGSVSPTEDKGTADG